MPGIAMTPSFVTIGCLLPASVWWLSLLSGHFQIYNPAIGDINLQALQIILTLQLVSVSLFSPFWATDTDAGSAHATALTRAMISTTSAVLPAWPLLAMLSLASGVSAGKIGKAQVLVFFAGIAMTLFAYGLRQLKLTTETRHVAVSLVGVVAAILFWVFRLDWFRWVVL